VAVCVLQRPRAGSARHRPTVARAGTASGGPRFLTSGRGEVRAPGAKRSCAPASRSRQLHSPRGTSETNAACRARPLIRLRPRRRVTQRPLKATRRGERRGNGGTDPDRDRWRWLRWHVLRAAGTPPACGDAEVTVVNPENHMLYTPLLPRDWNDARVFDQLHQPRLARCGPTEAAWLGSVQVLEPGHEGFVPGRSGCGDVSPSGRVRQPNRVRTVPGAQALQHTAGEVSSKGSRAAAAEFAMHCAGYTMKDPVDPSASPGICAGPGPRPASSGCSSPQRLSVGLPLPG
jgi:hypothetical protein